MTSEAIDFVANEFTNEQKLAVIDIIEKLAISDLIINNKELSLLFSVIEACYEEKAKIIKILQIFMNVLLRQRSRTSNG